MLNTQPAPHLFTQKNPMYNYEKNIDAVVVVQKYGIIVPLMAPFCA